MLFVAATGNPDAAQVAVYDFETDQYTNLLFGSSPSFAATGHLVFWRDGSLWAVPFDPDRLQVDGDPVAVMEGVSGDFGGDYALADDGTLVYRRDTRREQRTLVWVDRAGREEPIGMTSRAYRVPRLSPDGRRIAVDIEGPGANLFLYDLETQVEEQFTFDPSNDTWPLWSQDGSRIYLTSMRDGAPAQLYVKPADGSGSAERVLADHISGVAGGWSADGETLVFAGLSDRNASDVDIFAARLDGNGAHEPLLQTQDGDLYPTVSPNGDWLAYVSDETGERRIYVRPLPDTGSSQRGISEGPGGTPLWSRDGQELFYHTPEAVMVVPVETGDTFLRGEPTRLFSLEPYASGSFFYWDVSPDGQRFLMVKDAEATAESASSTSIVLVQNWFEELKRLVPTDQ